MTSASLLKHNFFSTLLGIKREIEFTNEIPDVDTLMLSLRSDRKTFAQNAKLVLDKLFAVHRDPKIFDELKSWIVGSPFEASLRKNAEKWIADNELMKRITATTRSPGAEPLISREIGSISDLMKGRSKLVGPGSKDADDIKAIKVLESAVLESDDPKLPMPKVQDVSNPEFAGFVSFAGLLLSLKSLTSGATLHDPLLIGEINFRVIDSSNPMGTSPFAASEISPNKSLDCLLFAFLHYLYGDSDRKRDFDNLYRAFSFTSTSEKSARYGGRIAKELCFIYMLVLIRGSLPSMTGNSCENPLPKILADNLSISVDQTERAFAELISTADTRKIKVASLLSVSLIPLPNEIKNRIQKGTAGSRPLKLVSLSRPYVSKSLEDNGWTQFYDALDTAASAGFCHLSVHPLRQELQSKFPSFYPRSILSIAHALGEEGWKSFLDAVTRIPSYSKDRILPGVSFINSKAILDTMPELSEPNESEIAMAKECLATDIIGPNSQN